MGDRHRPVVSAGVGHIDLDPRQIRSGQPVSGQPTLVAGPSRHSASVDIARHDHSLAFIRELRQEVGLDPVDVGALLKLVDGIDWQTHPIHQGVLHPADARVASQRAARNQGLGVRIVGVVNHQHGHVLLGRHQVERARQSVAGCPIARVVDVRRESRVGEESSGIVDRVAAIRDVVEHHQAGGDQALHESVGHRTVHVDEADSRRANRGHLGLLGDDFGPIVETDLRGVGRRRARNRRRAVTQHPTTLGFAWPTVRRHCRGSRDHWLGASREALFCGTAAATHDQAQPEREGQNRHQIGPLKHGGILSVPETRP